MTNPKYREMVEKCGSRIEGHLSKSNGPYGFGILLRQEIEQALIAAADEARKEAVLDAIKICQLLDTNHPNRNYQEGYFNALEEAIENIRRSLIQEKKS